MVNFTFYQVSLCISVFLCRVRRRKESQQVAGECLPWAGHGARGQQSNIEVSKLGEAQGPSATHTLLEKLGSKSL